MTIIISKLDCFCKKGVTTTVTTYLSADARTIFLPSETNPCLAKTGDRTMHRSAVQCVRDTQVIYVRTFTISPVYPRKNCQLILAAEGIILLQLSSVCLQSGNELSLFLLLVFDKI